ncbi:hypothetical protein JVU11DRAFT_9821 [Chiua virens]|nr:hypothetical protein JVU11DRAFT_9821 [Chiua virens]
MVASIANQDAIERFIKSFLDMHEQLNPQKKPNQHVRTTPSDHYYIAESSHTSENLTLVGRTRS